MNDRLEDSIAQIQLGGNELIKQAREQEVDLMLEHRNLFLSELKRSDPQSLKLVRIMYQLDRWTEPDAKQFLRELALWYEQHDIVSIVPLLVRFMED